MQEVATRTEAKFKTYSSKAHTKLENSAISFYPTFVMQYYLASWLQTPYPNYLYMVSHVFPLRFYATLHPHTLNVHTFSPWTTQPLYSTYVWNCKEHILQPLSLLVSLIDNVNQLEGWTTVTLTLRRSALPCYLILNVAGLKLLWCSGCICRVIL